jgi:hypothetical protein
MTEPRRQSQRKHGGYPNRLVSYREVFEVLANLRVAVKESRRARKLSLRDVAAESGVNLNSISRFERGGDMQLSNVIGLLKWLSGEPKGEQP